MRKSVRVHVSCIHLLGALAALAAPSALNAQDVPSTPAVPGEGAQVATVPEPAETPPAVKVPETAPVPEATPEPDAEATPKDDKQDWSQGDITLSGYAEAYYSHNFAKPENRVTNNRWLDERHNTFTLQTVALDVAASRGPLQAKVTLMFGPTADRWYFEGVRIPEAEGGPVLSPSGYNNETWKHIQTAYVGYTAPLGEGVTILGGLMPTQVGFEGAAIKDNWNWSRSNLFNFLPFFHLGGRISYPLTDALTLTAAVYNGWNQASDLNKNKTLSLQTSYAVDGLLFNLLYLGGNERPSADPAGKAWRNLFDAVVQYDVLPMLSLGLNLDGGFERNDLGNQSWYAGAVYARVKATEWLYFAARGDGIYEDVPSKNGVESSMFFGGDFIASGTFTAEVRPIDGISFRLEYRHDASSDDNPLFYKHGFNADGSQRRASAQNTLTLGMTGWF